MQQADVVEVFAWAERHEEFKPNKFGRVMHWNAEPFRLSVFPSGMVWLYKSYTFVPMGEMKIDQLDHFMDFLRDLAEGGE